MYYSLKCYLSLVLDWEFMLNESIDKSINGAFFKNYFKSRV